MGQDQFHALMSIISADIVNMITQKHCVSDKVAIKMLYTSQLYAALENEETKVWQYSTPMLYSLLEQEWSSGTIHYPDV